MTPERSEIELVDRAAITVNSEATGGANHAEFSQFMIADHRKKACAITVSQGAEAFAGAIARGIVADTDKRRVTRVITEAHHQVGGTGPVHDMIQQMIVTKRVAQPDIMAIQRQHPSQPDIANDARLVPPPRLLRVARKMNIAHDEHRNGIRHVGDSDSRRGSLATLKRATVAISVRYGGLSITPN